ncbi:MAG: 30S ribosomal protein S17 [Patescibacteria group bacterium]|nr:30S ribosomal protein S17 [Patescibacteria group bacterium]
MKKTLKGKVVSNKMDKTIVVRVDRTVSHVKYKKRYKVSKNFKAHAENSKDFKVGDKVVIEETRPVSRDKKWKVKI